MYRQFVGLVLFSFLVNISLSSAEDKTTDVKRKVGVEISAKFNPEDVPFLIKELSLAVNKAKQRRIWYFETENVALRKKSIVLRARIKLKSDKATTTVKIRPLRSQISSTQIFWFERI